MDSLPHEYPLLPGPPGAGRDFCSASATGLWRSGVELGDGHVKGVPSPPTEKAFRFMQAAPLQSTVS